VTVIHQRRFSERGPALSEISLGCAQLGNLYREVGDGDARATVDSDWGLGVRYFDTAPHYGLLSERRLGAALASRPRSAYVLSSKVGRLLERDRHGTSLPAAAIAFPLAHPAVVSVCLGARSAEQVQTNVASYRDPIPAHLWSELKATGLLRADAPVPA
jgi:aryl-alcohol dehydrogenase-like predicted oxidoreductase